ncbi:MAG: anion permease, partial [Deltaproteobacteria bacterium]|nr:anion permease [Deltaproteobacteria bacterium]
MSKSEKKATGYDKYVDWKLFIIPVILFFAVLVLPTPYGMKDVGTEYMVGPEAVINFIGERLFGAQGSDVAQWQLLTARIMEQNMQMGALTKNRFLNRSLKWCGKYDIRADEANLKRAKAYVEENIPDEAFRSLMSDAAKLRKEQLKYENLTGKEKAAADKGAWKIKVAIAMMVFVVFCFMTECIPLPGVAFCIGLILVFTGVVTRKEVAMLYWSDACWFIMGSLMFAAAFVKTGVDKRLCLMMFRKLAVPNVRWVTLIFFIIIAPLASFISDHALAAMFLPIGILLYQNSLTEEVPEDPNLAKMLMIAIAMACNIGGPGAPSGGARNVIMMTYLNDMFGFDIGYFQWVTYCMPFVLVMIPLTWFVVNWRFKPRITSLAPAMKHLQTEIGRMGGWNRQQIWAIVIFLLMVYGWFTEKIFY